MFNSIVAASLSGVIIQSPNRLHSGCSVGTNLHEIRPDLLRLDLLQLMFYKGFVQCMSLHTETLILVHILYWTAASGIKSALSKPWQAVYRNVILAINITLKRLALKLDWNENTV